MTLMDKACYERGCICYDAQDHNEYVEVVAKQEEQPSCDKQGEPVAYDVRCDNCGGDGYDPKDNNYFCSSCEGAGFLEKLLYTHPQQRKPLTDEQKQLKFMKWGLIPANQSWGIQDWFYAGIAYAEAAHGIKE